MAATKSYTPQPISSGRAVSDFVSSKSISRPAVSVLQQIAKPATTQFTGNDNEVIQGFWPLDWIKEQYHDYKRLNALANVMEEAVATMNTGNVNIINHNQDSDTHLPAAPGGQYTVRVNPNQPVIGFGPDDHKLTSIILHELTHVAVDQGYGGTNHLLPMNERPSNMTNILALAPALANAESDDLGTQGAELLDAFNDDDLIPDLERDYIRSRILRMANQTTEFDTVINELLLYFHLKGIPARSETSKMLTSKARARQALRMT